MSSQNIYGSDLLSFNGGKKGFTDLPPKLTFKAMLLQKANAKMTPFFVKFLYLSVEPADRPAQLSDLQVRKQMHHRTRTRKSTSSNS